MVHLVTSRLISASCGLGHLLGAGEARYISLHIGRCSLPTVISPGEGPGKRHAEGGRGGEVREGFSEEVMFQISLEDDDTEERTNKPWGKQSPF